ncbi:MAG: sulfotransferase family protein [Cyclobacteriaceae bacterium]
MGKIDFIQFIGTQRSGSNLLRLMLNQHPDISAHHPPHLLRTFVPLLPCYGDLSSRGNRRQLVEDMVAWVQHNPVPWRLENFDIERLSQRSSDITDILVGIYNAMMEQDKASIFCCKSTFNVFYSSLLERNYKPLYLYLYRDGRDVSVSFKKAIVGPKHIYSIAEKWHQEQEESLSIIKTLSPNRYVQVSYEQLIHDPEIVLKTICKRLGVDYDTRMLEYHVSEESRITAESGNMWKNVARPIIKQNQNKFRNELSDEEIEIFESVAGNSLTILGYQVINTEFRKLSEEEIKSFGEEDVKLRKVAEQNSDPHDVALRQPQRDLLKFIQKRAKASLIQC